MGRYLSSIGVLFQACWDFNLFYHVNMGDSILTDDSLSFIPKLRYSFALVLLLLPCYNGQTVILSACGSSSKTLGIITTAQIPSYKTTSL